MKFYNIEIKVRISISSEDDEMAKSDADEIREYIGWTLADEYLTAGCDESDIAVDIVQTEAWLES